MHQMTCENCFYWQELNAQELGLSLPPGRKVGHCFGMPPQVHMVPVQAPASSIMKPGQSNPVGIAPANFRPLVLDNEKPCSVGRFTMGAESGGSVVN